MSWTYYLIVTLHVLAALLWLGGMFFLGLVGAPALRVPALRVSVLRGPARPWRREARANHRNNPLLDDPRAADNSF